MVIQSRPVEGRMRQRWFSTHPNYGLIFHQAPASTQFSNHFEIMSQHAHTKQIKSTSAAPTSTSTISWCYCCILAVASLLLLLTLLIVRIRRPRRGVPVEDAHLCRKTLLRCTHRPIWCGSDGGGCFLPHQNPWIEIAPNIVQQNKTLPGSHKWGKR